MIQKIQKQFLSAFTLIEVLVVTALISIMSAILLVDFGSGRITQQLEGSARVVVSAVREAQNFALTGHQGVAGTDPCAYEVAWSGTTYTLTYEYKDGAGVCSQSQLLNTSTLADGISFLGASGNVSFAPPHAVMTPATTATIVLSKAGSDHAVCVCSSGLINNTVGNSCTGSC